MFSNVRLTASSSHWPRAAAAVPRVVLAALRSRAWLLVLLMIAVGALAYRAPYRTTLKIGGYPPVSDECYTVGVFDWPYLLGFNQDAEFRAPAEGCAMATAAYRWAFGDAAIVVPGIGVAPREFRLGVLQGRPDSPLVLSDWSSGGAPLVTVPIEQSPRVYNVLLPSSDGVDIAFRTPTFQGPNDPRELAFAVDAARIDPLERSTPSWSFLVPLGLMVGLLYAAMRHAGMAERWATLVGVGVVLALAALLAVQRTALTLFAPRLPWLVLGALVLMLVLAPLLAGLARRLAIATAGGEARAVAGLIAVAWLVRCLGLLHPQALNSDIGLNENNLKGVIQGFVVFEESLPDVAGGGAAPYPPAQYVMLAPLRLLTSNYRLLLIVANALVDSLAIAALWLMLRASRLPFAAAGFAGALYIFAEPLLGSLSIGELANVWGQALATFALAALVLWREQRIGAVAAVAVLSVAMVGHLGVFSSLAMFLATLGALLLLGRRGDWLRYALIVLAAGAVAFTVYYSAQLRVVLDMPPAPPPANSALQRLGYQLDDFWRPLGLIGPLATLLGAAGAVLAWRRSPELGLVLAAWWASVVLSWATLLWSQQALRWEAFLYPAVACGSGITLAALYGRGVAWRALSFVLLAATLAQGTFLWVQRVASYGH